jgi:ubiquinone/menaquinone biosynthesis C-methylase UbiE
MSDHREIQLFYDTVYYKDAGIDIAVSRHLRRMAKKFIRPEQQVLDVACGTGSWLMAVGHEGGIPSGIDLSPKAIDICKQKMPNGEFHSGPAESLPFKNNIFDVITCLGSLEHFLDPVSAIKEMVRVSREGALFIILVPNSGFLTRRLGLYKGTHQVTAREDVRSLEEWNEIFESGGLETINRWKDLHVLSWSWISSRGWSRIPIRALQGLALFFWPLSWQYQVYHSLRIRTG